MTLFKHALVLLAVCFTTLTAISQTTYYVKNSGLDTASGTSPSAAWQTLAKVTSFDASPGFQPGDQILLERGGLWNESSPLTLTSSGSSTSKITLADFGTNPNPPRISCFQQGYTAVCARVEGSFVSVQRVQFENAHRGIVFWAPGTGGLSSSDIEVSNCYFKNMDNRTKWFDMSVGLQFEQWGWDNVVIRGCTFDHVSLGVSTPTGNLSSNFVVDDCEAFGGWGAAVAFQNLVGGYITNTRVRDVGGLNNVGSTGLFLVSCTSVVISNCSVSGVKHGGGFDGCGIDFESNNTNCALANSFVFNNEGPAVLMFSGGGVQNSGIVIADTLFYNNNTSLHGSSAADSVLYQAGSPVSTGSISNCGIYKNSGSSGSFGGTWTGFTQTGVLSGSYCQGWTPVFGQFAHLSVGGNGHIAAVDSNNVPFVWSGSLTGNCWTQVSGLTNAATVSVGEDGELWATDTGNGVWRYAGSGTWSLGTTIRLAHISVGSAANIWGLKTNGTPYLRTSGTFNAVSGSLTDLDAGPVYGQAWGVNGTTVQHYVSSAWSTVSGALTQISMHGDDGTNDIVAGVNGTTIQRTTDTATNWHTLPGALVEVSEGSDGTLWGLDSSGFVWRAN